MDPYAPIDRPVRTNISLQNMTYMFSKEFLRFRKEDISDLFILLQFPDKVRLENRSTMSGEEVFMRGLYELCTGAKKALVSEVFGRHPSDQCRAFNYFISHIYNNFYHLMTDNLQWWFENGLMERSAAAIEEKLGARPICCFYRLQLLAHGSTWRRSSRRRTRCSKVGQRYPKSLL